MKAFVTGSTGFLGSELVRQLLSNGHQVVAMARHAAKGRKVLGDDSDAQIVVGDMLDIPAFAPHMAGCDVLFHVAAYFKEYTGIDQDGEQLLQTINVDGTIAIMEAAKAHGVKHVVYVSSGGVIGPIEGGVSDESTPHNVGTTNRYFQSKIRAEIAISEWLPQHRDMFVVVILPGAIIGPGDNGPTGVGHMIIELLNGSLPATPPGAINFVDVRDVARAMIVAVDHGKSGERYLVTGRRATIRELAQIVADVGGVKPPRFTMPMFMILTYAAVAAAIGRLTRRRPQATRILVRTLNEGVTVSNAKAERELGVTFRPMRDSIIDEIAWFRTNGYT